MKSCFILFVADDESAIKIGREMFESLDHSASFFNDSLAALQTFQRTPYQFDLVITDFNMPGLNGTELAVEMRAIRKNFPIILATGNDKISQVDLHKWGIAQLLLKPYQMEELDFTIKQVIASSSH